MKPSSIVKVVVLAAVIGVSIAAWAAKPLTIQVREVQVKSAPNYLSGTVGTLGFGAAVEVSGEEGNWYRIATPQGFIPKNATGTAKANVDSSQKYAAKGVSNDETALAGKGFNPQVEQQYKRDNAQLAAAFAQVDRVERMDVPLSSLQQFIAIGKLNP